MAESLLAKQLGIYSILNIISSEVLGRKCYSFNNLML